MDLMGKLEMMNREEIIEFIKQCQHENGGIGASIDHDPHILYTLSAVQVMVFIQTVLKLAVKLVFRFCVYMMP